MSGGPSPTDAGPPADGAPPAPAGAAAPEVAPSIAGPAPATILPPLDPAAPAPAPARAADEGPPATGHGWTAERQRRFLDALAEGQTVEAACALVGLAKSSAYALRRRETGRAFALGWTAACLLARDRLADTLMSRAMEGQLETYTRADGACVTRHRYDNRLAAAMLSRLDRLAETPMIGRETNEAARLVASDWETFAGLIGRDDLGPAAAGLFLATRGGDDPTQPSTSSTCAGADATGTDAADDDDDDDEEDYEDEPVWRDEDTGEYWTSFPPPDDFAGTEEGVFGDDDYARTLTPVERAAEEAQRARSVAEMRNEYMDARNLWFGFTRP